MDRRSEALVEEVVEGAEQQRGHRLENEEMEFVYDVRRQWVGEVVLENV